MTLWQTLFGFDGRIGRATLWLSGLAILLIDISILLVVSGWVHAEWVQGGVAHRPDGSVVGAGLGLLVAAVLSIWTGLALKVKRFHDRGRSGWWLLTGLIPVAAGTWLYMDQGRSGWWLWLGAVVAGAVTAWLLVDLGLLPGSRRRNRYGDSPDSVGHAAPLALEPEPQPEPVAVAAQAHEPEPEPVAAREEAEAHAEPEARPAADAVGAIAPASEASPAEESHGEKAPAAEGDHLAPADEPVHVEHAEVVDHAAAEPANDVVAEPAQAELPHEEEAHAPAAHEDGLPDALEAHDETPHEAAPPEATHEVAAADEARVEPHEEGPAPAEANVESQFDVHAEPAVAEDQTAEEPHAPAEAH